MKSLIILAALVAFSKADGSVDSFQTCFNEAKNFKTCIFQKVNESIHTNVQQLKGFKEAITKCFEQDGVKGICSFPSLPAHTTPAGGFHFPTPSPAFATCFNGAKGAFLTCFKEKAGIPEGFKPEGLEGHQQHSPPPFAGLPQFPHDPKEIKAKVLEVCSNNQGAANKLEECAKQQIKPFIPALLQFSNPMIAACQAGAACAKSQPISADCKAKLEQGGKAFCACRQQGFEHVQKADECSAARSAFKDHQQAHEVTAQQVEGVAAPHHDFPQHPHQPFDFCAKDHEGKNPENICKALLEKKA